MKDLIRKIFKKGDNADSKAKSARANAISDTTNAVFDKYKKSFKDLARYDKEGKAPAN